MLWNSEGPIDTCLNSKTVKGSVGKAVVAMVNAIIGHLISSKLP